MLNVGHRGFPLPKEPPDGGRLSRYSRKHTTDVPDRPGHGLRDLLAQPGQEEIVRGRMHGRADDSSLVLDEYPERSVADGTLAADDAIDLDGDDIGREALRPQERVGGAGEHPDVLDQADVHGAFYGWAQRRSRPTCSRN